MSKSEFDTLSREGYSTTQSCNYSRVNRRIYKLSMHILLFFSMHGKKCRSHTTVCVRGYVSFSDDRSNNNSREMLQCPRIVISSTSSSFLRVSRQNNKITHPKFIEYFEQISEFYGDWRFRVGVTSIYLPEIRCVAI